MDELRRLLCILYGLGRSIRQVTFHPAGRVLAGTSLEKGCRVWDLAAERCLVRGINRRRSVLAGVSVDNDSCRGIVVKFDPSGGLLVMAGNDGRCRF